jgi:hypothetical protein
MISWSSDWWTLLRDSSVLEVTTYLHEPQRLHGRWYLFLGHGFCVISENLSGLVSGGN